MSKIVNTCVICGNLKVYYDYIKSEPSETLNPMGNFYRWSHLHKETQRFMETNLQNGMLPKIDEEIFSDKLCSSLKITNIIYGYQRDGGEGFIHNLEKEFLKQRDLIRNSDKKTPKNLQNLSNIIDKVIRKSRRVYNFFKRVNL